MANATLAELKLAAELAVAISQFMQSEQRDNDFGNGFIGHMFQGPFDENGYVLWELGVALAAPPLGQQGITFREWSKIEPDDVGPSAFQFMPPDQTRAIVMAVGDIAPALALRLLETYLRSMGDYSWRGQQLDVGRETFAPEPIFEPQIQAFIECGYVERSGNSVRWKDRINPAMVRAGFWDAELKPPSPHVITITLAPAVRTRVERLLRSDQRIDAIAAIRDSANVELTEAKWFVEQMEKSMVRE